MRLVFKIQGRAAIPVRVIPYITGWLISPDEVASKLAQRDAITPPGGRFYLSPGGW